MLGSVAILSFFLLTVQATGQFSILEHPNSLEFKGNDKLDSNYIDDVLAASLGLYVETESKWEGLYINNPFDLPKGAINFMIEGVNEIQFDKSAKSFPLLGSSSKDTLNMITSNIELLNSPAININLDGGLESLLNRKDVLGEFESPIYPKDYERKNSSHADELFFTQVEAIKSFSNKISEMKDKPTLININLSLKPLVKDYGANSENIAILLKHLAEAIEDFSQKARKSYSNQLLFTVVTDDSTTPTSRHKRQTQSEKAEASNYNLATRYNEDYPVIFNIILWFMVVFVLALVAVSYSISTMDPGRDSIIYRMTSTRMKKDN